MRYKAQSRSTSNAGPVEGSGRRRFNPVFRPSAVVVAIALALVVIAPDTADALADTNLVAGDQVTVRCSEPLQATWNSARTSVTLTCPSSPSTASPSPSKSPDSTSPTSGGYCSDAVHDSYKVKGMDGKLYHGWHPQRDPSGCYFGHDHGSDPSLFSAADEYVPAFGFVNAVAGVEEPHTGFKIYRIVEADGQQWLWTIHIGTSGYGRVCQPFHSIELAIADANGSLLAELRWIADFGKSEANGNRGSFEPDACPNQAADAAARGSVGGRQLSVNSVGPDSSQYEPWKPDLRKTVFGFPVTTNVSLGGGSIAFNNKSSMTTCADIECNSVILSNHRGGGAYSVIQSTNFTITPKITGQFTTDMFGLKLTSGLPQYIAAGWKSAALTHSCTSPPCNWWPGRDPNVGEYQSRSNDQRVDPRGRDGDYNVDGMLKPPN